MLSGIKCITCIIDDLTGALETLQINEGEKYRILKKSLDYLMKNFSPYYVPSRFITDVHRIIKRETGIDIPFQKLRKNCNSMGLRIAELLEKKLSKIKSGERKFNKILRWCVAGNHLDFRTAGKGYGFNIDKTMAELKKIAEGRFNVNECKKAFSLLMSAKRILFIHDNVGEIAIDKLLIKFLKEKNKGVLSALRGGAITSDATIDDGIAVGLDRVADGLISAGPDTLGISWEEMSDDLRKELKKADVIISKGQANFYVLSEHLNEIPPVVFLLTTKCDYASGFFGFRGRGGVINIMAG